MKTEKEIRTKLEELLADERMSYPPATIDVNAPLALIQLSIEQKAAALKWVLDEVESLMVW